MPSGPPELHAKWKSENAACEYLLDNGYKLTGAFTWLKPRHDHIPTDEELEAINYLCLEWDYGELAP